MVDNILNDFESVNFVQKDILVNSLQQEGLILVKVHFLNRSATQLQAQYLTWEILPLFMYPKQCLRSGENWGLSALHQTLLVIPDPIS